MSWLWDRTDTGTSVVLIASVLVLAGALAVGLALPLPNARKVAHEQQNQAFHVKLETIKAEDLRTEAKVATQPRVWAVPQSQIGPSALQRVTALAQSRGLKLLALRPQRAGLVEDFTQLPFIATVEGSFPQAMAFVRELESPANKLAVSSIQIASSDSASDTVSLTVALNAFVPTSGAGGAL